jgi:hypothetical protein
VAADPYNFDPRFERAMVFLACSRPAFYGSTGYALEVEALAAPEARLAMTAAHAVFTDLGRGPDGLVIVLQRLRRMVDPGGRVTMVEVQNVDDYFTAAEEDPRVPLPTEEQAVSELAPILRRRMEKTVVRAAGDTYSKRGDMGALVRLVNELGRIGRVNISLGTKLGPEMAEEIASMRHMERLSTGVLELDTILDGGLPRGSLGVVVADTGGGKSLALAQVAASAVLAGLFVVVATLEVPRPVWLSRALANITGIPINTILEASPEAPREPAPPPHDHASPVVEAPPRDTRETSDAIDCTFCGKSQREVKKLVSGPYIGRHLITICDECVALCGSIIVDDEAASEPAAPEVAALPEPDLRPLFPRLFATPSPRITPIAEQCAARGEEVPVGQTAGVLRALGYVVPLDVDSSARLIVSDDPKASTASTGRLTGYAWKRDAYAAMMWLHDHPEMLSAISHESLAEHYAYLRKVLRREWSSERAASEALTIVTANVMLGIYTEARRREGALEAAVLGDAATAPPATAATVEPSPTT